MFDRESNVKNVVSHADLAMDGRWEMAFSNRGNNRYFFSNRKSKSNAIFSSEKIFFVAFFLLAVECISAAVNF